MTPVRGTWGYASGEGVRRATPVVVPAANSDDVMREQFDYIMEHVARSPCDCRDCRAYLTLRKILLDTRFK